MRRFNWLSWSGLAVVIFGFVSYFTLFARYPLTRDVPWVSYLMFAIGLSMIVLGWRRAPRKIAASVAAALALLVAGSFTFVILSTANLPSSSAAPSVGEKVPDFTLSDAHGRQMRLAEALAANRGVLLIFYRGYW